MEPLGSALFPAWPGRARGHWQGATKDLKTHQPAKENGAF